MFTKNSKPRPPRTQPRGRPPGPTPQGTKTKAQLYAVATRMIATRGYEATTLRDIAREAKVSPGLLYRYFPSKRAIVLALYDALSEEFSQVTHHLPKGTWSKRFHFALKSSLEVLATHRGTMKALAPMMVGGDTENLFSNETAFSRHRVQAAFTQAVHGAEDCPSRCAQELGRVLYFVHLGMILFWLLDKSPQQVATHRALKRLKHLLPLLAMALKLPPAQRLVQTMDGLLEAAFFEAAHDCH